MWPVEFSFAHKLFIINSLLHRKPGEKPLRQWNFSPGVIYLIYHFYSYCINQDPPGHRKNNCIFSYWDLY